MQENMLDGHRPCKRCGQTFLAYIAELYCPQCREIIILSTGKTELMTKVPLLKDEIAAWQQDREAWDYRIIDELGREVWALDLAQRYRKEMLGERREHGEHKGASVKRRRQAALKYIQRRQDVRSG